MPAQTLLIYFLHCCKSKCGTIINFSPLYHPSDSWDNKGFYHPSCCKTLIKTFNFITAWRFLKPCILHSITHGTPVAQWAKCWSADLAVPSSSLSQGEIFLTVNSIPLHTTFHNHPPIVLIWLLKRTQNCKSVIHPSITHMNSCKEFQNFWLLNKSNCIHCIH